MCYNCFRFGHLKTQCKSKELCQHCGNLAHPDTETCPIKELQPVCVNCRQNHLPKDRSCPEWLLQKRVRSLAATCNLSLDEAYTQVVCSEPPLHFSRSYSNFKNAPSPLFNSLHLCSLFIYTSFFSSCFVPSAFLLSHIKNQPAILFDSTTLYSRPPSQFTLTFTIQLPPGFQSFSPSHAHEFSLFATLSLPPQPCIH